MSGDGNRESGQTLTEFPDPSIITEEAQQKVADEANEGTPPEGDSPPADETDNKKDDGSSPPADDGEKVKSFAETFPDFAELVGDKNISVEDGKKLINEVFNERQDLTQSKADFEKQYEQYFEMDSLMNTDKELAEFIWTAIKRKKEGKPLTRKEEKAIDEYEDDGTLKAKPDKEKEELKKRVEGLESEFKNRDKEGRVHYYKNLIDSAIKKHSDKDGKSLLTNEDIALISERAIAQQSDDIVGIADKFVEERNSRTETIVQTRLAEYKETVKAEVIKEYLGLKAEDKEKFVDIKDAQAPAGAAKTLSLEDGSAKKGFLSDLKASIVG